MCAGDKYHLWTRMMTVKPNFPVLTFKDEITPHLSTYKFGGQGQNETPVVDARGLVKIINHLRTHEAALFRDKCADIFVRYMGGDMTLVREIRNIRNEQERLAREDPMHPARVFGEAVEAEATAVAVPQVNANTTVVAVPDTSAMDIDIVADAAARMRAARKEEIELMERSVGLFRSLIGDDVWGWNDMDKIYMKDAVMNLCSSITGHATNAPNVLEKTLSEIYKEVTGRAGNAEIWRDLGKVVAAEYRARHDGKVPEKRRRFVGGTACDINAYCVISDPWIYDVVRDFSGGASTSTQPSGDGDMRKYVVRQ